MLGHINILFAYRLHGSTMRLLGIIKERVSLFNVNILPVTCSSWSHLLILSVCSRIQYRNFHNYSGLYIMYPLYWAFALNFCVQSNFQCLLFHCQQLYKSTTYHDRSEHCLLTLKETSPPSNII